MAEVLFYHLTRSSLEATLPTLLERSLARGWRAVVRAGSAGGLAALDAHLWTYRDDAFLPHGRAEMGHGADQPVYLTLEPGENPNGAAVAMLVDGARFATSEAAGFQRLCLLFDGHNPDALEAARADWRAVSAAGLTGTYWAEDGGRWVEKARNQGEGA